MSWKVDITILDFVTRRTEKSLSFHIEESDNTETRSVNLAKLASFDMMSESNQKNLMTEIVMYTPKGVDKRYFDFTTLKNQSLE